MIRKFSIETHRRAIDIGGVAVITPDMKRFGILLALASLVLCQTLSAAEKTAPPNTKSAGVRAEEKSVPAKMRRGKIANARTAAKFLVLRVETGIEGGKQKFTATASVHTGSPTGEAATVDRLLVRITQPASASGSTSRASKATAIGSADAAGGKFKTVVADALMITEGLEDTKVAVTVPGDR